MSEIISDLEIPDSLAPENYDETIRLMLVHPVFSADVGRALRMSWTIPELNRTDRTKLPYRSGVWAVSNGKRSAGSHNDLIFFWPLVLERLLPTLRAATKGTDTAISRHAHRCMVNDDSYTALLEALEHHVLRSLPGGVTVPCPAYAQAHLQKRFEGELDIHKVSVLRFSPIFLPRTHHLSYTFNKFSCLSSGQLPLKSLHVLLHMPIVLRLLYLAMTQARFDEPGVGWAKWGLLWGRDQLYFNHRVAIDSVLADEELAFYFEGMDAQNILASLTLVPQGRRILRHPTLPALSDMLNPLVMGKTERLLRIVKSMEWVSKEPRETPEDYTVFSLTGGRNVLDYFTSLQRFSETELEYLTATLGSRPKTKRPVVDIYTGAKPLPSYVYADEIEVTVNAQSLGFRVPAAIKVPYTHKFIPMTIKTMIHRANHFMTLPLELTEIFTALRTIQYLPLNYLVAEYPELTVFKKQDLYFDLKLLDSDGPVWKLLDRAMGDFALDTTVEDTSYIQAYKRWCQWFHDPDQCVLKPEGEFWAGYMQNTGEMKNGMAERKRPLETFEERFDFFRQKGKCVRKKHMADGPTKGRSGRIGTYDRFVFWYVAAHIIEADIPPRPTDQVYAEYMSKRWMPWRKPSGNIPHLKRIFTEIDPRTKAVIKHLPDKDVTLRQLLQEAEEQEMPFTWAERRTGIKDAPSHYAYVEDRLIFK